MRNGLIVGALVLAAFAGGWFTHKQTQQHCYVIPGYTNSSNSLLQPDVYPPELVCK